MSSLVLPSGQVVFNNWYATEKGQLLLKATNGGMMMFAWDAEYDDGRAVRQYHDEAFIRALRDEDFIPPEDIRLSVDSLERDRVQKFTLTPIAFTRKNASWFQHPIEARIDLKSGDRFLNFWETDWTPRTGYTFRRTVLGIERNGIKVFVVISPSGKITICSNTNQSFEGE